eukprot:scaffold56187_cov70-Cyclotella_meneghiniana.AAC.3
MDGSSFLSFEVDVDGGNVAGPGGTLTAQSIMAQSPISHPPIAHHPSSQFGLIAYHFSHPATVELLINHDDHIKQRTATVTPSHSLHVTSSLTVWDPTPTHQKVHIARNNKKHSHSMPRSCQTDHCHPRHITIVNRMV